MEEVCFLDSELDDEVLEVFLYYSVFVVMVMYCLVSYVVDSFEDMSFYVKLW